MGVFDISGNNLQNTVYDINGNQLQQAYDIEGDALFDTGIITVPDSSTGTYAGYSFTMDNTSNLYLTREVADFMSESPNLQSFCYDSDRDVFYRFDATETVRVYDSSMQLLRTVTMPSIAGHNNDATYFNGKVYMTSGIAIDVGIWVWDVVANTVTSIPVNGVVQPTNGSLRMMAGIFKIEGDNNTFILAYQDYRSDDELHHEPDDMWSIYYYSLSSNNAVLKAEFPWDCYAVQGVAMYDGIIYATCNYQTEDMTAANQYKGILLKVVRTDTWSEIDSLLALGTVEPESLNIYPFGTNPEFMMGVGKYNAVSKIVRFTIPYRLIES